MVKIALGVISVERNPWSLIKDEAQAPLFLRQMSNEVTPFWLFGREATSGESSVLRRADSRISRDVIFQHMDRFLGARPVWRRPGKASNALRDLVGEYSRSRVMRIGQDLYFDIPEAFSTIGIKTIWFLKYLLESDEYTHFFRTNISSYVDFQRLARFVLESDPHFAAVNVKFGGQNIPSGAGILLSQLTALRILRHEGDWNHGYVDDVALGLLMTSLGSLGPSNLSRFDFHPSESTAGEAQESVVESATNFHWRCKSKNPSVTIQRMLQLQEALG